MNKNYRVLCLIFFILSLSLNAQMDAPAIPADEQTKHTSRRNGFYKKNNNNKKNTTPVLHQEVKVAKTPLIAAESEEQILEEENGVYTSKPKEPIRPSTATDDSDDLVEINFDNADLQNILNWLSDTFKIKLLSDDALNPPPASAKLVAGNKLTFKTQKPLTKKQVWDLCLTFLDLFGLTIVDGTMPDFYKVVSIDPTVARNATKQPLPSYVNIAWQQLPNSDMRIRYTYFIKNSTLGAIQSIVDAFKSTTALLKPVQDLNAFVLTDKASNVRSVMQIVEELDGASAPEAMSVLKLKHADAEDVKALYDNLIKTEDAKQLFARLPGARKLPTAAYFPENTRIFAERRTNTLIILGTKEGIEKVENFIINFVDTELKLPYSPLYVYELQYTKAEDVAQILNSVTKFAPDSPAAQSGGVRDGDKYLRPMFFQAEPSGNRLLINAEKEDYLKVVDIIKQLDVKQRQVAIEVLIVNVVATDDRELGVQIRNKDNEILGPSVDFQTSGFPGSDGHVVLDPQTGSLMGNLVQLANNQTPGSLLISIANTANSVWAIFKVLQTYASTNVVANPFLVTTNNYQAQVSIGESRYVQSGIVSGVTKTSTFQYVTANLTVQIKPLINAEGIVNLDINISIDAFTNAADPSDATQNKKEIKTIANVGNREVLAIGGLLQSRHDDETSKVPILGDIPILGWLFKNKTKTKEKDNLIVFISPRLIEPKSEGGIDAYSEDKAVHAKTIMCEMHLPVERRDVLHRWFFKDRPCENTEYIDNFIEKRFQDHPIDYIAKIEAQDPCFEHSDPCDRLGAMHGEQEEIRLNNNTAPIPPEAPVVPEPVNVAAAQQPTKKRRQSITNFLPKTGEVAA